MLVCKEQRDYLGGQETKGQAGLDTWKVQWPREVGGQRLCAAAWVLTRWLTSRSIAACMHTCHHPL